MSKFFKLVTLIYLSIFSTNLALSSENFFDEASSKKFSELNAKLVENIERYISVTNLKNLLINTCYHF